MCDNRTVSKFQGDISDFKMQLRRQMQLADKYVLTLSQNSYFLFSFFYLFFYLSSILSSSSFPASFFSTPIYSVSETSTLFTHSFFMFKFYYFNELLCSDTHILQL